ncbi:galactosylceramide sulfotransferase-like, partial [Tropilaelaps mercedesae]
IDSERRSGRLYHRSVGGPVTMASTRGTVMGGASRPPAAYAVFPYGDLFPVQCQLHVSTRRLAIRNAKLDLDRTFKVHPNGSFAADGQTCVAFLSRTPLMGVGLEESGMVALLRNETDQGVYPCKRKEHIFFMKTHKCASSSLQNVLFRYGDKHNLTIALPLTNANYFGHPGYFNRNMLQMETTHTHRPIVYSGGWVSWVFLTGIVHSSATRPATSTTSPMQRHFADEHHLQSSAIPAPDDCAKNQTTEKVASLDQQSRYAGATQRAENAAETSSLFGKAMSCIDY